jgi:hypothetical protein
VPFVEFEPTIPVCERAKTDHALDRAATVIGENRIWYTKYSATINNKFVSASGLQRCHIDLLCVCACVFLFFSGGIRTEAEVSSLLQ